MPIRRGTLRQRKKEKRKIELKIEAKDFGPISKGKVTLKPFTLFIGPNNSGKSYAAMLIHSIFESYAPITLPREMPFFMRGRFFFGDVNIRTFLKGFPELKRQIDDLKGGVELEISKQFIEKLTNKIFEGIYEKRLSRELARSYACPLKELIRIGKSLFALKINFNSYDTSLTYQRDKLKIKIYPQLDFKIRIKTIESPRITIESDEIDEHVLIIKIALLRQIRLAF